MKVLTIQLKLKVADDEDVEGILTSLDLPDMYVPESLELVAIDFDSIRRSLKSLGVRFSSNDGW